jgi:hypothetical protein
MKNKFKHEDRNSRKRQRMLDSDDEENGLNQDGVLPIGKSTSNSKQYDNWNLAKKELNEMLSNLT